MSCFYFRSYILWIQEGIQTSLSSTVLHVEQSSVKARDKMKQHQSKPAFRGRSGFPSRSWPEGTVSVSCVPLPGPVHMGRWTHSSGHSANPSFPQPQHPYFPPKAHLKKLLWKPPKCRKRCLGQTFKLVFCGSHEVLFLGKIAHACSSSDAGGGHREILSLRPAWTTAGDYSPWLSRLREGGAFVGKFGNLEMEKSYSYSHRWPFLRSVNDVKPCGSYRLCVSCSSCFDILWISSCSPSS